MINLKYSFWHFYSSALIILYEHASTNGQSGYSPPAEHELRDLGIAGLQSLVPMITEYAIHIRAILPYNIDHSSPFVCNCLYRMAVWLSGVEDVSTKSNTKAIKSMKDTLRQLSKRWRVAGMFRVARFLERVWCANGHVDEYLRILDDFELTYPAADEMALDVTHEAYNPNYMYPTGFVVSTDAG